MKRLDSKTKETILNLFIKTSVKRMVEKDYSNPCYICLKKVLTAQT
jgi:uncharacterized phosphosugar-binding protein